jgi:hypothetical protein
MRSMDHADDIIVIDIINIMFPVCWHNYGAIMPR